MGRPRARRPVEPLSESADLNQRLRVAVNNLELAERRLADGTAFQESVADLEARLNDPGWQRFVVQTEQEFTPEGRRQMRAVCRLSSLANPLVKRGLNLRSAYVHGGGVEHTARANGKADGEQDVQAVVAGFLADEGNRRAYTGAAARDRLEHTLGTDGEFYLCLFTRPMTGDVQVRVFLADEVTGIICNPEDRTEPWFYRRAWVQTVYAGDGSPQQVQQERLYPAVDHRPAARVRRIGSVEVAWDSPVLHVAVGRPEHWQHGIPDVYAAVNWARAYKTYLEQWATLMSALSRFAWRLTAKGNARGQVRTRLATAPSLDPATGTALDVGATALMPGDQVLEAIPKSGATIDSESGRPLAMMVAAALDVPVTMLLSDPGQTGARATAETLDQPTELAMQQRRELWAATDRRVLRHVVVESVRAPQGALHGTIVRDRWRDVEVVTLDGDTDTTIDIVWPDLDDVAVKDVVEAVAKASDTGTVPPEVVLRLLLAALGVRDADSIIEAMLDDDGRFVWPSGPSVGAGQAAVDAARAGEDPAAVLPGGRMTPGDQPDDTTDEGD